jgi:hypothetical protein
LRAYILIIIMKLDMHKVWILLLPN